MARGVLDSCSTAAPIVTWWQAITARQGQLAIARLREAYEFNRPLQAEIIFAGGCAFTCQHCIYADDFALHNRARGKDMKPALRALRSAFGVDTFVYSGRAVNGSGTELLVDLRSEMPDARIGLIDNGISLMPFRHRLMDARLNWIDISVDGARQDHDRQRNRVGSFDLAVEGIETLIREQSAPRINVLSCLTTLNKSSLPAMIWELNRRGVKNFFVTPVVIASGLRPAVDLAVSNSDLRTFVFELEDMVRNLRDAYVEMLLTDVSNFVPLLDQGVGEIGSRYSLVGDHVARVEERGTSTFCIRYFPSSLVGIREFIINVNGDVIVPLSMAFGPIPQTHIFGNVLHESPDAIWSRVQDLSEQAFYTKELMRERRLLTGH